ncbi:MAG: hypothetical protein LBH10_01955, partial [Burkholderiaceae bacterium]|nr:hypothetical protein [Burkholderiaceae bacterium]
TANYLRYSGVPLAPVPPDQRFNPNAPVQQYTEQYATRTTANGTPVGWGKPQAHPNTPIFGNSMKCLFDTRAGALGFINSPQSMRSGIGH